MTPVIKDIVEFPWHTATETHPGAVIRQARVFDPTTDRYYLISENSGLDETLIFSCDSKGDIQNYSEVGGAKCIKLENVIGKFQELLYSH